MNTKPQQPKAVTGARSRYYVYCRADHSWLAQYLTGERGSVFSLDRTNRTAVTAEQAKGFNNLPGYRVIPVHPAPIQLHKTDNNRTLLVKGLRGLCVDGDPHLFQEDDELEIAINYTGASHCGHAIPLDNIVIPAILKAMAHECVDPVATPSMVAAMTNGRSVLDEGGNASFINLSDALGRMIDSVTDNFVPPDAADDDQPAETPLRYRRPMLGPKELQVAQGMPNTVTPGYALTALMQHIALRYNVGAAEVHLHGLASHPETDEQCQFADLIAPAMEEIKTLCACITRHIDTLEGSDVGAIVRALSLANWNGANSGR